MSFAWAFALLVSLGFRFWGFQHPDPFVIRPALVFGLLFAPSVLLGVWLLIGNYGWSDSSSVEDKSY